VNVTIEDRHGLQNFLAELFSGIMYADVQNVLRCMLGGLRVNPAIPVEVQQLMVVVVPLLSLEQRRRQLSPIRLWPR
jgi:hypothetical protein